MVGLRNKHIFLGAALVLVLLVLVFFYQLSQEERQPELLHELDIAVAVQGLELVRGEKGQIEWKLQAVSSRYDQEKGILFLEEPRLEFFLQQGDQSLIVQGQEGTYDQSDRIAKFSSNVQAFYNETLLEARALEYREKEDKIYFAGPVVLRHQSMQARGEQAVYDLAHEKITLEQQVGVDLRLKRN